MQFIRISGITVPCSPAAVLGTNHIERNKAAKTLLSNEKFAYIFSIKVDHSFQNYNRVYAGFSAVYLFTYVTYGLQAHRCNHLDRVYMQF